MILNTIEKSIRENASPLLDDDISMKITELSQMLSLFKEKANSNQNKCLVSPSNTESMQSEKCFIEFDGESVIAPNNSFFSEVKQMEEEFYQDNANSTITCSKMEKNYSLTIKPMEINEYLTLEEDILKLLSTAPILKQEKKPIQNDSQKMPKKTVFYSAYKQIFFIYFINIGVSRLGMKDIFQDN